MEFNSLPVEVHLKIFSHLSAREVMKVRRVCKQWNRLINAEVKFKQLVCGQYLGSRGFGGFEKFGDRVDFIFSSTRSFGDYVRVDHKFSRVKCLEARLGAKYTQLQEAFDFLNAFRSLEDLRLCFNVLGLHHRINLEAIEKKQFTLKLDHVKEADLFILWNSLESKVNVLLDMPNLVYLAVFTLKGLTVGHPKKLKTFATEMLFPAVPDYSQFTGLRTICTRASDVRSISVGFIEKLPKLNTIHLDGTKYTEYSPPIPAYSSKAGPRILFLGFEISLNQILLEGDRLPHHAREPTEDFTRFIARNLQRSLDGNPYIPSVDYNTIAEELDDTEMFGLLFQKLPNIRHIRIAGTVADESRLLKFIDKFQVDHLQLERASLSPDFFEKSTKSSLSIKKLEIRTEPTMCILSGDFDFIFKLKNLVDLHFEDCSLPLSFVAKLLRELKSLEYVKFLQVGSYEFFLNRSQKVRKYTYDPESIFLKADGQRYFFKGKICPKKTVDYLNELSNRLKADGFVSPPELLVLLHQLRLEGQTNRFMMRKLFNEPSIYLPLQMHQLNLLG